MKKILLPTDFTEQAKLVIRYGLSLYEGETCICTLLHVMPVLFTPSEIPLYSDEVMYEDAQDSQNDLIRDLRQIYQGRGFHFKSAIETGDLAQVVAEEAEENEPDLVIMGTQGGGSNIDLFLGSNTSAVVRKAGCPVLVVPFKGNYRAPKKIVFAVDLKHKLKEQILAPLLDIGKRFDAEILILQVILEDETVDEAVNGIWISHYLKDVRHSFHTIHNKDIPEGIDRFSKEQSASMVAIVSSHHKFLDRIFHKSVTKNLALHSEIPLLVMHTNDWSENKTK